MIDYVKSLIPLRRACTVGGLISDDQIILGQQITST